MALINTGSFPKALEGGKKKTKTVAKPKKVKTSLPKLPGMPRLHKPKGGMK